MGSPFSDRQAAFFARLAREPGGLESGVTVVLPSTTFSPAELVKIVGIQFYEERLLYLTLLLARPDLEVVYVTSLPVEPVIVDYYLGFLPEPEDARRRLHLVTLDEPEPQALSVKLLRRDDVLGRVREMVAGRGPAYVLPFNVTVAEQAVADRLDLPLFGPHPELAVLGTKSGARRSARRAGVAVPDGAEDLRSVEEVADAVLDLRGRRPDAEAVVIKLNNGFSGQGNAIIELDGLASPLELSKTTFCASEESWPSFAAKVAAEGAIVEELIRRPGLVSPSVQLRIAPGGSVEIVSTHDQILGGPDDQVYLGCRFPARADYRRAIAAAAERVAAVLSAEGVVGPFGIDFLVEPDGLDPSVWLSEINLRMGGTTHPFGMARLVTGGTYDSGRGELIAAGRAKSYLATDNLKSPALVGRHPAWAIDVLEGSGLAYDPGRGTGATLHLLGALSGYGKLGVTCIGDSGEEAEELYGEVMGALGA